MKPVISNPKGKRGQSMVEFALLSVFVLFVLAFGIIDLSRLISTSVRLASVVREGGRLFVAYEYDDTATTSQVTTNIYTPIKDMMLPDDVAKYGQVIISTITRIDPTNAATSPNPETDDYLKITAQWIFNPTTSTSSLKGSKLGTVNSTISSSLLEVKTLSIGEEMVVVEIWYPVNMITPIKSLAKWSSFEWMYDSAYF